MNGIAKMEDGANNGLKVIGFLNKFVAKVWRGGWKVIITFLISHFTILVILVYLHFNFFSLVFVGR
jgi:hypothetical protein